MFDFYPNSDDPLAEPAVVLIDEIDLHLHPKWQRQILSFLSDIFKNAQFIATTHSPLIVQGIEEVNLAVLRRVGNEVIIDNDVEAIRNWRADQLLTSDLFDLESARPLYTERLLKRRKTLLSKSTMTSADVEELNRVNLRLGDLATEETHEANEAINIILRAAKSLRPTSD